MGGGMCMVEEVWTLDLGPYLFRVKKEGTKWALWEYHRFGQIICRQNGLDLEKMDVYVREWLAESLAEVETNIGHLTKKRDEIKYSMGRLP